MFNLKNCQTNEPLAKHTTFGIGGPADYFFVAKSKAELVAAIRFARQNQLAHIVLGGASNILVADKGWRGLVIKNQAQSTVFKTNLVEAESGVVLTQLVKAALVKGLSGLEHFAGIPGSLGGALFNNAHYQEYLIGDLVLKIEVLDQKNQRQTVLARDCQFAYEFSRFQKSGEIILQATLKLKPGDQAVMEKTMQAAIDYRLNNHPQEKSIGCIFQNPPDRPAAELITAAGLKGRRVGGAMVSPKHAGFIINADRAKAADVLKLIAIIKQKIKVKFGIELKEEIFLIGDFE
ncbi:UDP-N-acetylmuramate dehydrogenase [Patescibacteria group bacterium]|nr:UDP-N-acetylmuramate dehydrogenase [Patescibacteria group bacterium]MBU1931667.1 UDP-N-acetylmuramate dehydrogenase [Patescibacteria group bacterium]